jgi:hypothetical protein
VNTVQASGRRCEQFDVPGASKFEGSRKRHRERRELTPPFFIPPLKPPQNAKCAFWEPLFRGGLRSVVPPVCVS